MYKNYFVVKSFVTREGKEILRNADAELTAEQVVEVLKYAKYGTEDYLKELIGETPVASAKPAKAEKPAEKKVEEPVATPVVEETVASETTVEEVKPAKKAASKKKTE